MNTQDTETRDYASLRHYETRNGIANALYEDFEITATEAQALQLFEHYRRQAKMRFGQQDKLEKLRPAVERLDVAVKMGWLHPWKWLSLPAAAKALIQQARELGIFSNVTH